MEDGVAAPAVFAPQGDVFTKHAAFHVVQLHTLQQFFELRENFGAQVDFVVAVLEEQVTRDPIVEKFLRTEFIDLSWSWITQVQSFHRGHRQLFVL